MSGHHMAEIFDFDLGNNGFFDDPPPFPPFALDTLDLNEPLRIGVTKEFLPSWAVALAWLAAAWGVYRLVR